MRRVKLTISYDGTAYHGWQRQKNEPATVEETVERALSELLGEEADLHGASRTDAGVHALGQVAHFETAGAMPAERIAAALNGRLPEDIRVIAAEDVPDDFHARFGARRKRYRYTVFTGSVADPLRRLSEHHHPGALNVAAMREAAACLVGRHDFRSFEKDSDESRDSTRELFALEVRGDGERITLELEGDGFLYNMVRAIAGTLLEVGRGKRPPGWVGEVLEARDRSAGGPTLPAKGLCLLSVEY